MRTHKVFRHPWTESAVMHKTRFHSTSVAVTDLKSMELFGFKLERLQIVSHEKFVFLRSPFFEHFSFVQLPKDWDLLETDLNLLWSEFIFGQSLQKDYYRPYQDCVLFDELAFNLDGDMVVEIRNLEACLRIWDVKEWLTDPSKNYPFSCSDNYYMCLCHNIVETLWHADTFRRIFSDVGISQFGNGRNTWSEMSSLLLNYAKKLYTGEEMVANSSRALNVLTSSHVKRLAASDALKCKHRYLDFRLHWL